MYEYRDHIQNKVLVGFFSNNLFFIKNNEIPVRLESFFLLAFLILRIKSKFEIIVLCLDQSKNLY